jgi:hypothetical protein
MRRLIAPLLTTIGLCSLAFGVAGAQAAAPTIPLLTLSHTTTTSAVLEAEIDPQGKATRYHFEYGPGDCSANPCAQTPEAQVPARATGKGDLTKESAIVSNLEPGAGTLTPGQSVEGIGIAKETTIVSISGAELTLSRPATAGGIGVKLTATGPQLVGQALEGLTPGTVYHFRVVANNGETAESPDRTMRTHSLPPVLEPCPNDALRSGPGAHLPDCRAYEQASPVDKNGGDLWTLSEQRAVSIYGDAVAFMNDAGLPGAEGEQNVPTFLASRGPGDGGWSTQGVLPPPGAGQVAHVVGWTPDLSRFYSTATKKDVEPQLNALLARSGAGASLSTLGPYAADTGYMLAGATSEGSVVLFETATRSLGGEETPGAGKRAVFAFDRGSGEVTPVGVLNTPAETETTLAKGAMAGPYEWMEGLSPRTLSTGGAFDGYYTAEEPALAADGSAAYFTAAGSGDLYVRLNPTAEQSALDDEGNCTEADKACTLKANVATRAVPDPAGAAPAAFQAAGADGTKAFFTSTEKLTDDANTGPEQEPPAISRSDLEGTPASIDRTFVPAHALGIAVDSEHVYWVDPRSGAIGRADLNGGNVDAEFISATDHTRGLAVAGGYIYWTNGACLPNTGSPEHPVGCGDANGSGVDGSIGKAKLNANGAASEVKQDFVSGVQNPWAVAANGEFVYWTSSALAASAASSCAECKSFIGRVSPSGASPESHFIETQAGHTMPGIALTSSKVYWMELDYPVSGFNHSFIDRANIDGTGYTGVGVYLEIGASATDLSVGGRGIAIQGNHIYWAAQNSNDIGRAKISDSEPGSEIQREFIKGAGHPYGIATDGEHLYWSANGEASPNPGNDLYRFEPQKPASQRLVDLTPDPGDENGAEVRGVLGTSADGSYVYFAANGVLAPGATPGNCSGVTPATEAGTCNVYLAHGPGIEFVTRMAPQNWLARNHDGTRFASREARVSTDGQILIYANEGIRRYDASSHSFNCVSCNPSGEPLSVTGGQITHPGPAFPGPAAAVMDRFTSSDGRRVFFETTAALVAEDTNGFEGCPKQIPGSHSYVYYACQDVYEWEAEGEGTCRRSESEDGGCLYLISSGKDSDPSFLAGASASGADVFIFTRSRLVGQDQDDLRDVYDARVEGGLPAQNQPPPNPCAGEGCKEDSQPPPGLPASGSQQFQGPGDPLARRPKCRRPRALRHRKCIKPAKHGRHRKGRTRRGAGR